MWTPQYDYLEHHGIDGQKWGHRNGPPYPLDYKSHSAEEKRKNSKSLLSGNKGEDKKAVKKAFKKAKYARAATLSIEEEAKGSKRAYEKGKINAQANKYVQRTSELAKKRELEYDKELNKLASEFVSRYGDKSLKSIDKKWDKTVEMTAKQGQRYIAGKGTLLAYGLFGIAGGVVKGGLNLKEYGEYKNSLRDD